MELSHDILIESKSARTKSMINVTNEVAQSTLADATLKAKALLFMVWEGGSIATTKQLAEYYQVSEQALNKIFQRHKEELALDGVKVIHSRAFKGVLDSLSGSSNVPKMIAWTPKGALRVGFLLTQSLVASEVRTIAISYIEKSAKVIKQLQDENAHLRAELEKKASQTAQHFLNDFCKEIPHEWAKFFPDEYFLNLYRICGVDLPKPLHKSSVTALHFTMKLYRNYFPEGTAALLKQYRGHKNIRLHQHLTNIGQGHLIRILDACVLLMRCSPSNNPDEFWARMEASLKCEVMKYSKKDVA